MGYLGGDRGDPERAARIARRMSRRLTAALDAAEAATQHALSLCIQHEAPPPLQTSRAHGLKSALVWTAVAVWVLVALSFLGAFAALLTQP